MARRSDGVCARRRKLGARSECVAHSSGVADFDNEAMAMIKPQAAAALPNKHVAAAPRPFHADPSLR